MVKFARTVWCLSFLPCNKFPCLSFLDGSQTFRALSSLLPHKCGEAVSLSSLLTCLTSTYLSGLCSKSQFFPWSFLITQTRSAVLWCLVLFLTPGEEDLSVSLALHSSTLAWKIPWMEEPGGLQSMGLRKVRHD